MTDHIEEPGISVKRRKLEETAPESDGVPAVYLKCEFFIKRKNRPCSMQRKATEKYCSEHMIHDDEGKKKRVPCPLDPSHTVWEYNLKKHVKKCNTRPSEVHDEWYELNINSQPNAVNASSELLDDKELYAKYIPILQKIDFDDLEFRIEDHRGCWNRLGELQNQKHALQQLSLIGNLCKEGLLSSSQFYVEFGCGKAELSRYVNLCVEQDEKNQPTTANGTDICYGYGLIDRGVNRMKMDNKIIKESSKKLKILRSHMDIKDFSLLKFQEACNSQHIVGISKHLCGSATDLTLSAVLKSQMKGVDGLLIAMCCRHVCQYEQLLPQSRQYLAQHGFNNERAFHILKKMVSWAVCGKREEESDKNHISGLSVAEREQLGFKARRLVDQSRVEAINEVLTEHKAEMFWYTSRDTTLENVALLIKKCK